MAGILAPPSAGPASEADSGMARTPTLPTGSHRKARRKRDQPDLSRGPGERGAERPEPRSVIQRLTGGFAALSRSHPLAPRPQTGPFVGPPTSAQLMALRQLNYIAEAQGSALGTALVPLREGRRGAVSALRNARTRLLTFAALGLVVFLFGVAVQVALIRYLGMGHISSYIVQTALSIQLSFPLSRYLTWPDRNVPVLSALVRFNLQQLAVTGLGVAVYAGLDHFGMNYIASNIAVTAVLTPVSLVASDQWSMAARTSSTSLRALPWPLFPVLAVQILLSMRLIWSNTTSLDEATCLFVGGQDLSHWIHGVGIIDYQRFLSGSPAVYPPIAALANAVGGLTAARFLSLAFMTGATCLLYVTATRLFDKGTALLAAALFACLAGTQFLGALATLDPMALFLLALSACLVVGRQNAYDTLTDIACSTVIAGAVLALANADKYATALWDPVVIGLACCAPSMAGYPWRYGVGRALRFAVTLGAFLVAGLAVGKAEYLEGIMTSTVARWSSRVGMGQPASLVVHEAWNWVGLVLVLGLLGVFLLLGSGSRFPHATRGSLALLGVLLLLAAVVVPLSQARVGTTASLQKHVIFGAWFGCALAGWALSRILNFRVLIGVCCCALLVPVAAVNAITAQGLYNWPAENPAFISALKEYVRPGNERYLISGFSDIPAYYAGDVSSFQWKQVGSYNGPALAAAIKRCAFTLVILNFNGNGMAGEPYSDYSVAADIASYGDYKIVGQLPPSDSSSNDYYTVWRATGDG
jgi:putative flippase GtrA